MARIERVVLTDDLDGTEAADIETVMFGLDGAAYEVDLTPKNRDRLVKALTPFLDVARKAGKAPKRTKAKSDAKAVRAWAASNGYEVPARGRIPAAVQGAYDAAN